MKANIVKMALTFTTIMMIVCSFAACKSTGKTSSSLSSTVSKVTSGVTSAVSSITK